MSQSIVRHYRAVTREEAAQAYRSDALKAAGAGYVAIDQTWSEDPDGLLLAVTYSGPAVDEIKHAEPPAQATAPTNGLQHSAEPEAVSEAEPEAPAELEPEPSQPERIYTPVQRISTIEPDESAEREMREPEPQPAERYTPPPEMYEMPEGMYVPVVPQETPEAEPRGRIRNGGCRSRRSQRPSKTLRTKRSPKPNSKRRLSSRRSQRPSKKLRPKLSQTPDPKRRLSSRRSRRPKKKRGCRRGEPEAEQEAAAEAEPEADAEAVAVVEGTEPKPSRTGRSRNQLWPKPSQTPMPRLWLSSRRSQRPSKKLRPKLSQTPTPSHLSACSPNSPLSLPPRP